MTKALVFSEEELLEKVRELADAPWNDRERNRIAHHVRKKFGSWENACRQAGVKSASGKHVKKWTEEEDEYIKKHYTYQVAGDIGKKFGRSKASIASRASELGVTKRKNRGKSDRNKYKLSLTASEREDNKRQNSLRTRKGALLAYVLGKCNQSGETVTAETITNMIECARDTCEGDFRIWGDKHDRQSSDSIKGERRVSYEPEALSSLSNANKACYPQQNVVSNASGSRNERGS